MLAAGEPSHRKFRGEWSVRADGICAASGSQVSTVREIPRQGVTDKS